MTGIKNCREHFFMSIANLEGEGHDCMDAGGTSPRMGEDRTMQEQLSRATH